MSTWGIFSVRGQLIAGGFPSPEAAATELGERRAAAGLRPQRATEDAGERGGFDADELAHADVRKCCADHPTEADGMCSFCSTLDTPVSSRQPCRGAR